LRAGVTATVSIDTGRGRSIADVVSGFFDLFRGKAQAAGGGSASRVHVLPRKEHNKLVSKKEPIAYHVDHLCDLYCQNAKIL
jgi:hypothetical protein